MITLIKHPTVFVFLGNVGEEEILSGAEQTHPKHGFFSIRDIEEVDIIKTRIQSGESGLNIKRVHVYVIVEAGAVDISAIDTALIFRRNFATVVLTLVVILNEASGTDNRTTHEFLQQLSESETPFDRIFLLSDKNENDIVNLENRQNIYKLIANLPLLHNVQSSFDEIMTAKAREQGRTLFVSAGFWKRKKPEPPKETHNDIFSPSAIKTLHHFAKVLDKHIADGTRIHPSSTPTIPEKFADVASSVISVPARPLKLWDLLGRTIKEAEIMLYGKEAIRFFEDNYTIEILETDEESISMTLCEAVAQEKHMGQMISDITLEITQLSDTIEATEAQQKTPLTMGLKMLDGVDHIKDVIGECYAMRYQLNYLQGIQTKLFAQQQKLTAYISHIRDVIQHLKGLALPEIPVLEETPQETPDDILANAEVLAPFAISLLRNDGLLHEQHILYDECNEPCLIRLIGGFTCDLYFFR
ncbi:MAG: hypothetical protein FWE05_05220 [Defluviitaleaceae bacterium]|nr:hypothetical protein [Defluviitaleaceae bacterium]